jgi:hypothetical protein
MQRESQRKRTQRQLRQESRSSAPDNEDSDSLSPSGLGSSTATPRGSHLASWSTRDQLRSILDTAIAVLAESDDEVEDSVESSSRDDPNFQP